MPVPPTVNGTTTAVLRTPPPRVTVNSTSPTSSPTLDAGLSPARAMLTSIASSSANGAVALPLAELKPEPLAPVKATVTVSTASFRLSSTWVTVISAVAVAALVSSSSAVPGATIRV